MIETKIPKDIRKYKTKLVGPFTLRTIECVAVAIVLDVLMVVCIFKPLNLSLEIMLFLIIFLDVPVFAFVLEPQGVPMERYLKEVVIKRFTYPIKRKAKNEIVKKKKVTLTEKERKEKVKKSKQMIKKHPEMRPYK